MVDAVTDEVTLRVPARTAYARIVRVGAAALALRQGMSFSDIDDLRLAIDEAMIVLLEGLDSHDTDVDITVIYRTSEDTFELEADRNAGAAVSEAAIERFDAIAADLVDDYDIDPERAWLRLRKAYPPDEMT